MATVSSYSTFLPTQTHLSALSRPSFSTAVGDTTTYYKFNPGCPVFNQIQIKTSSGAIICDIDDYNTLQKLLGNFDPDFESNALLTVDYRLIDVDEDIGEADIVGKGVSIKHNILAGLFSQEHYLPVDMFSGSAKHSFAITHSLNDPKMCMSSSEGAAPTEELQYTLYNCNLQVEVVQLPESVSQKLNAQLMKGEKVSPCGKLSFSQILHSCYILFCRHHSL